MAVAVVVLVQWTATVGDTSQCLSWGRGALAANHRSWRMQWPRRGGEWSCRMALQPCRPTKRQRPCIGIAAPSPSSSWRLAWRVPKVSTASLFLQECPNKV
eukprot:350384-Chlamydomonas_euryale.AAC.8